MATTNGITLKNQNLAPAREDKSLKGMLGSEAVKKRFNELLGKKAPGFISSLLSVVNNNKLLAKADPVTVISAEAMAAALDLPINQNLGFAYIVPYGGQAQFQMGYKGYIQLAMRTGQYKTINAVEIYEGEVEEVNRITGEYKFGERSSDKIVGYMAYFRLVNGFEKYLYMSVKQMQAHAKKYSHGYKGGTEKWGLADFHTMAIKTVLKRLISKYGVLSIEMTNGQQMAMALENDGGVIREQNGSFYADFDGETVDADPATESVPDFVDAETGEVLNAEAMFSK